MAVDTAAILASLQSQYTSLMALMATLPAGGVATVSEGGRSFTMNQKQIEDRLEFLEKKMAQLGAPVGTVSEPFVIISRTRP